MDTPIERTSRWRRSSRDDQTEWAWTDGRSCPVPVVQDSAAAVATSRRRERACAAICAYCTLLLVLQIATTAMPLVEHPWLWIPVGLANAGLVVLLARSTGNAFGSWWSQGWAAVTRRRRWS